MSKKNKNHTTTDTPDYHTEVASVSSNIVAFFNKTFSEVHFDGPELDLQKLQSSSPVMIVSTHRSHVDYFALGATLCVRGLKNLRFAAGDNLTNLPWIGPRFLSFGAFPVSRSAALERNYIRKLCAQVVEMLEAGDSILVFPEGGRSYSGAMLDIKGGVLNAALMAQAANPERDVCLLPAAISYERPPDAPWFPMLLKGKSLRGKKPGGFITRTLGSAYYFGADIAAFAPFMVAKFFRRNYGAVYMDYSAPVPIRSLVDLEANRIKEARDEFGAHRASLHKVGAQIHKLFMSLYRLLPVHIVSAAVKEAGGSVNIPELEARAAELQAAADNDGRNCKTISGLTPEEIVSRGLKTLRKMRAVKVKNKNIAILKPQLINYFAATLAKDGKDA